MKRDVVLSIQGRQHYGDQEPETIELVTEGTMEFRDGGWDITYEESELTGLAGVVTTFRVEPGKVTLNREGALNSRMLFQEGVSHESLYQMEFGTLMITVKATNVFYDIAYADVWAGCYSPSYEWSCSFLKIFGKDKSCFGESRVSNL